MTLLPAVWASAAALAEPALRISLRARTRRGKEIGERLAERRGEEATPRPSGRLFWVHAASVGESVSVLPVIASLARRDPAATILLTTGTATSARLMASRLPELGFQGRVLHRFVPLDVPRWAARFLDHWRPDIAAFVESELWPNLLGTCRERGIPLALLNARMSSRSFGRWRRSPGMARHLLSCFQIILAQSSLDAERLSALGAVEVEVAGNLKFAAQPLPADATELARLRASMRNRPCWVAASTHPAEEPLLIGVQKSLAAEFPGAVCILAPRHPERGRAIAVAAGVADLPVALRSDGAGPECLGPLGGILVADTLGELGLWYRLSPIAFVGRSLVPPGGGQNPLEPARLGCAVAVGPYTGNFVEPVRALRLAGALTEVADARELGAWVGALLSDRGACAAAGERALASVRPHDHLPERVATLLLELVREANG